MANDLIFTLKKIPLQNVGYQDLVEANAGNPRLSDNFVNLALQDSENGGSSKNIKNLLAEAERVHEKNLAGLESLSGTKPEYHYITIFCRHDGQHVGETFPIINAVEGVAIHKDRGTREESSHFLGLIFASHIRDAYRSHLDDGEPRDLDSEALLSVLAQAPFQDPSLHLPPPIYMISRRGDHETSDQPTRTEGFFNALGMGCVPHTPFSSTEMGADRAQFRYLTFDQDPRTVISSSNSGQILADKGFMPAQIATMSALGWPLFASIQPQLYDNNVFAQLPAYDHHVRLAQTPMQKRKALDWLAQEGLKEAIQEHDFAA